VITNPTDQRHLELDVERNKTEIKAAHCKATKIIIRELSPAQNSLVQMKGQTQSLQTETRILALSLSAAVVARIKRNLHDCDCR
jgi:hypothetical protein